MTGDSERYAKVAVVAPDGSVEDAVKVQFGYDQPLGIDPLEHEKEGRWPNDYKLRLRYLVLDGVTYYPDGETRPLQSENDQGADS